MQSIDFSNPIIVLPFVMIIVIVLFFIIYSSRYRKFTPNVYVIWLRNGEVRKVERGGSGWLSPLTDQIIVLPTTIQSSKIDLEVFDYKDASKTLILETEINSRVIQPEIFYTKIFSTKNEKYWYGLTLQLVTSFVRDMLSNENSDTIYKRSRPLLNELKEKLNNKLTDYGILIESFEFEKVNFSEEY